MSAKSVPKLWSPLKGTGQRQTFVVLRPQDLRWQSDAPAAGKDWLEI